jgi:hypothetical protein
MKKVETGCGLAVFLGLALMLVSVLVGIGLFLQLIGVV